MQEVVSKIFLNDPVYYDQVVELMTNCSIYVLASRTEAMGRTLIEAMASKKPIIASRVDGVPSIIKHNYNGLLFEKENVMELSQKIELLITDKKFANKLASNGFKYFKENLTPELYLKKYSFMIENLIHKFNK